jgi:hypothetical protein
LASCRGQPSPAVQSIKLGAASHVTKPADADQIIAAFHTARSRRMKRLPPMESLRPGVVAYLVKRVLASHGVIERDRDTYALGPAFASCRAVSKSGQRRGAWARGSETLTDER